MRKASTPSGAFRTFGRRAPPGRGQLSASQIVLVYVVVGALWILFSDRALESFVDVSTDYSTLQTIKGWVFVAITGLMLLFLIRRSRRGLETSESRLRAMFESSPDAIVLVDLDGRMLDGSTEAARMLGARTKRGHGEGVIEIATGVSLKHLDGRPVRPEEFATFRALRGEVVPAYEGQLTGADGVDRYVSVRSTPVREGERIVGAITVLRDITREKELELTRDAFMADAAHELKTPMTTIRAHAQLLEETAVEERPELLEPLRSIQRQVERLDRIVKNLMEASRLRAGGFELEPEPVDLADLAAEVVADLNASAPRHAIELNRDGGAPVYCDRVRVQEVLRNLVDNAVRFQPAGGPIQVDVARRGGRALIHVRDKGVGIPAEAQRLVFQPFTRPHAATPYAHVSGIGVGLYVSDAIIRDHGGRMGFESVEGHGSTFFFDLPLAPGSDQEEQV